MNLSPAPVFHFRPRILISIEGERRRKANGKWQNGYAPLFDENERAKDSSLMMIVSHKPGVMTDNLRSKTEWVRRSDTSRIIIANEVWFPSFQSYLGFELRSRERGNGEDFEAGVNNHRA